MKIIIIRTRHTCSSRVFISHVESIKAVKSYVYPATAIGISWDSTARRIWSFSMRAPSGFRMEIYYWSQKPCFTERYALQS